MPENKSCVSEYLRVRHYVMDLVRKTDNAAKRMPTILELSKKFNVSRPDTTGRKTGPV